MDIQKNISDLVGKFTEDKSLAEKFKEDPQKTLKSLVDVDLPADQLDKLVDGVQAKLDMDKGKDLLDKAKGLFDK